MAQPRYTRRKTSRSVFWSRIVAGMVVLFPLSLSHLDFRSGFSHPLAVSAYKSSPAYAAFEDARTSYASDDFKAPTHTVTLASGTKFDIRKLETLPVVRRVALQGLKIQMPRRTLEPQPVMVAGQNLFQPTHVVETHQLYADETSGADFSITSLSERARELVRNVTESPAKSKNQKVILSSTGTRILISRADSPVGVSTPTPPAETKVEDKQPPTSPSYNISGVVPVQENQRPLWLNGQLEMTGGLAFVGPETQLIVKRMYNGSTLEKGRIWVTEGKFEIHVKRALGYLVAELYTRDGRVLGRGEIDLLNLDSASSQDNRITDLRIALRPTTDVASLRAVSGYSHQGEVVAVNGANVEIQAHLDPQAANDEGFVSDSSLTAGSTFVARANAKKNWSSLVVGQARHPQDIRLFSNSMMEALIQLELSGTDRAEAFHKGVIWGQIRREARPVEGATVEMAGDYQPIYFDEAYLPDPRLTSTAKNGLFAFVKVNAGVQAVRVRVGDQSYPAQVFPTEDKHVSYLEFELRDKVVSQFKVLDILDQDKPISAKIHLVGTDSPLSISGDEFVEYGVAGKTYMVEADPGPEFEVSRTTVAGTPHLISIPVVRHDWLGKLAQAKGIVPDPSRGPVIGFIDDQDFDVEMTGYGPQERQQIVYFDAKGDVLDTNSGHAGGGFVIFNAPRGLQTVYVHPTQSRETFAQVVVAEPAYAHVLVWAPGQRN